MTPHETSPRRHLAAVWFADIVGYTELAARDELAALKHVERLQALARDAAAECEGRIVKGLGDAVLAEFSSTEAAVRAALLLRERYGRVAEGAGTARLRVGVHVGDVVAAPDGDVYGDGVNVASRLQHECQPGEVLVTGDVWRQLRQRVEYRFVPLGQRKLRGLEDPIEVFAVDRADGPASGAEGRAAPARPRHVSEFVHRLARPRALLALGALLVLGILAAWLVGRSRDVPSGPVSSSAIAILPFSIRGSDEIAYLGEGMVSLLSTTFDGAGDLRSVDSRAVLSQVEEIGGDLLDPAEGRRVAERFGARWYVMGDILEIGGRIRVDATLYDARDGERVEEGTAEGATEEVFSLVDQVTAQLLAGMSGGPAARVDRIATVTTSSLPALKAYLEGQYALRNGDFETAVYAFERAVEQDTLFALGYYRLSIAAEWLLRSQLSHESAQRAFQYADRLSERDRKLMEAFWTFRRGESQRAEASYRSLVATYPDDVEAWLYLGELLFHINPLRARSYTEAEEPFLEVLELEPNNTAAMVHLARIASAEGRTQDVDHYVGRYIELTPQADRLWPMRALSAFSHGNPAEQDRLLAAVERVPGVILTLMLWDVALYSRHITGAERLARVLAAPWRSAEERALGHVYVAHLLLAQGRWSAARDELEAAEALGPAIALENRALLSSVSFVPASAEELSVIREDLRTFEAAAVPDSENPDVFFAVHNGLHPLLKEYLLGLVSARLGDFPAAEAHSQRTAAIPIPPWIGTQSSDLGRGVRAQALIGQDRTAEALEVLEDASFTTNYNATIASPFASLAYERFTEAELLHELGQDDEALAWYRHMFGCNAFELVYLALSHLRQGEIHEKRGAREEAARHYAVFLDLWKDADPEFRPVVEEGRRALARVRSR